MMADFCRCDFGEEAPINYAQKYLRCFKSILSEIFFLSEEHPTRNVFTFYVFYHRLSICCFYELLIRDDFMQLLKYFSFANCTQKNNRYRTEFNYYFFHVICVCVSCL
ncbi:Uncharacterised protein at_DN0338 [Pycnogonum litorale]